MNDSDTRLFTRVVKLVVVLHIVAGAFMLLWPAVFTSAFDTGPVHTLWVRWLGALLVLLALFTIPAGTEHRGARYTAILTVVWLVVVACFAFFAGEGFLFLAVVELILAVVAGVTLWQGWRRRLVAKP